MTEFQTVISALNEGFLQTLKLFFVTLVGSMPLGLIICFGSMNRWAPLGAIGRRKLALSQRVARMLDEGGELVLDGQQLTEDKARSLVKSSARWSKVLLEFRPISLLCRFVVWVIRGTPLMLQLYIIFYIPGYIFPTNPWSFPEGRFAAASVMFIVNYACYFSEIYRGGIEAVPKGQTEAGQVLGMTKTQIFFKVTLLQVVKRILAPMGNEVITLVKDTSLANTIANKEIIMMAKEYSAKGLIWPLFSTAIFFLVFVGALTLLFGWAEKKLDYFR